MNLDLNQLLALLPSLGAVSGPQGILIGAAVLFGLQWARKRWPNLKLPNLNPVSPSPVPSPDPAPAPSPLADRPVLDLLLKLLGGRAVPILADAVRQQYAVEPEAAQPVK